MLAEAEVSHQSYHGSVFMDPRCSQKGGHSDRRSVDFKELTSEFCDDTGDCLVHRWVDDDLMVTVGLSFKIHIVHRQSLSVEIHRPKGSVPQSSSTAQGTLLFKDG